jgi:type II secretory pathway component GspD/PulD (secretin)
LKKPVSLNFKGAPLSQVIEHIAAASGIDIVVDGLGLAEEGVTSDAPVSICVDGIQLRGALNLLLKQKGLGWTVEDEVLKITSGRRLQGRLEVRTYPVADLVVPIPHAPRCAPEGDNPWPTLRPMTQAERAATTDFDSLIELVTTTVAPDSWVENGGEATVRSFETTLSLVVRQTDERHAEIRDLLEQLRRLQSHQVTMEFRFITVPEDFFERVGIDFDFNVRPAVAESRNGVKGPPPTPPPAGQTQPSAHYLEDDIQYFPQPVEHVDPACGVTTENGQVVLTPEEARRFMECVQRNERASILRAPKVTAFNGQTVEMASVTMLNPHTTSVEFALAARPVISGDRRVISGVIQSEAGAATGEARTIEFRLQDGHTLLVDCGEIESPVHNRQGTPVLSRVPYVSRLFKNTAPPARSAAC